MNPLKKVTILWEWSQYVITGGTEGAVQQGDPADECDAFDSDVDEGSITQGHVQRQISHRIDESTMKRDIDISNTPSEYMEDNKGSCAQKRCIFSVRMMHWISILMKLLEHGVQM
ncbi:hypothetical protein Tco_0706506 [Tanacetum coccineum]|uniref:Uncharacterized protein n=1 Tax=Tanacetum coccineum TaxID=301880 RepID=A0ABQ4Y7Q1_9ASTR